MLLQSIIGYSATRPTRCAWLRTRLIATVAQSFSIEQLEVALENLERNLHAANMGTQDIVKLTFYLVGEMDAARRRDVIAARLQSHQPCMTLLFVAALASPIYKVEIDAWASSAT